MAGFVVTPELREDLRKVINRHSLENGSNTPDFVLADFLVEQLNLWNKFTSIREKWHGRPDPANHNPFTDRELASGR